MLKSTIENVENEKYKLQPMNTHYLKRIEKINLEEVYFCIEKSDVVSIEALETHIQRSKKAITLIGEDNVRTTLQDCGNGLYQTTIIYFEKSLDSLMDATKDLTLLETQEASEYILVD
ncbi:hypothetical protein NGH74_01920 [Staphylococcus pseudoxylosus]|uniref:hypothetical protein n=1 Tax=Staphylococcus pseudoxylosus TaxID=2282419 RepID=UPI000D1E09E0|nr:hypothetical protein [Staphylococcus pseudoxylosus]PTI59627.1 hypothetical protein BU103_00790 [Staphylococcus xylosus]MDW8797520.1 hypothetical protein [Staphylococcus pseudoxylosus]MEB6036567.1 hypothetical protein [Staphylococcus pseudoxylosus]MEB6044350.1 hypothetical protein [Staphylococcus pseudoxylosus]MEB7763497.1 hypothetical protein [Staphylococcus pseudoxylosus]